MGIIHPSVDVLRLMNVLMVIFRTIVAPTPTVPILLAPLPALVRLGSQHGQQTQAAEISMNVALRTTQSVPIPVSKLPIPMDFVLTMLVPTLVIAVIKEEPH